MQVIFVWQLGQCTTRPKDALIFINIFAARHVVYQKISIFLLTLQLNRYRVR